MPELLTLKSKVKLGCDMCDTCCKYRGDIRVTIKNVFDISNFLDISPIDFMEQYTYTLPNEEPEIALKSVGEFQECILYDTNRKLCSINSVKPLQCVVFPLAPESIKNDYFYIRENSCRCKNKIEMTVNDWLNGNNNIYKKNKKINYEWANVIIEIQYHWNRIKEEDKENIINLLYFNYDFKKKKIDSSILKNIKKIYAILKEYENVKEN